MSSTVPESVEPRESTSEAEVTVRRAPKYPVFLVLGAVLGLLATLILTSLYPADPQVGFGALFGYFSLYGVPAGLVIGALIAILFDLVSARRATRVRAEQTTVDALPLEGELED
ncbi:hypothetical protein BH09ACT3_BH09ACT3_12180 [soil metagenome]